MSRRGGRQQGQPELCRGCRGHMREWQQICDRCWARLPHDKRKPIMDARRDRDRLKLSSALRAAVEWLKAHPEGELAARVTGEREHPSVQQGERR